MPGATPIYGFPYPIVGESPHGPNQIEALAGAVETKAAAIDAAAAVLALRGIDYVAQSLSTANSATYNGSEVMLWTITFDAIASRRYVAELNTGWSVVTASTHSLRVQWKAGLTVALTDAEVWTEKFRHHTAGAFDRIRMRTPAITGITAGQVTFGISMVNEDANGDGSFIAAANNQRSLTIYDVGAA